MAKDISNGIEKTLEVLKSRQSAELGSNWRDLRNKLDSMLLATNVLKTNDAMQACRVLDRMDSAEREQHILGNWGPQYLERAKPLLIQLDMLERKIEQAKDAEDQEV